MNAITKSILIALSLVMNKPSIGSMAGEHEYLTEYSSINEKMEQCIVRARIEDIFKEYPNYICENYHCTYVYYGEFGEYDGSKVKYAEIMVNGEIFSVFSPICLDCSNIEQVFKTAKLLLDQVKRRFPNAKTSARKILRKPPINHEHRLFWGS